MNQGKKLDALFSLLKSLEGHDVDKMTDEEGKQFCGVALERFRYSAAPVPEIVLGEAAEQGYDWHVEACEYQPSDYVCSLKIVHTGQMERALGAHEKLRMAAALFPASGFEVALFGDFRREGGLQSDARFLITLSTDGGENLQRMSTELKKVRKELEGSLNREAILRTMIIATENACPVVVNPDDIGAAFGEVAKAARQKAKREPAWKDDSVTERVAFSVEVANRGADAAGCGAEVLKVLGSVFVVLNS